MKVIGYYYLERGQQFKVDDATAAEINRRIMVGDRTDSGTKTYYPIFGAPSDKDIREGKTSIAAWRYVHGEQYARWYWQVCSHTKRHSRCHMLDHASGLCGMKVLRYLDWNDAKKQWEVRPMVNHATPEQEKVLDSIKY